MRIVAGVVLIALTQAVCAAEIIPPQPDATEFHFVVLGDAQFDDPPAFNRLVDQARRLRPAFVIQVGDLIEGYNSNLDVVSAEWARFRKQVAPLAPIRYLPVPGNHDTFGSNKKPDAALERLFEETWGPLHYAFEYQNALFVILNSDARGAMNSIRGKQLTWLRETLESSQAAHKFAFMHRPPFLMRNAEPLHELFRDSGVSHVFYGHHHHYHYFELDGVHYSMTNAAGDSVNDQPLVGGFDHLLQVAVRGEEVSVAVIAADAVKAQDSVAPADNYDYFSLSRGLLPDTVALRETGQGVYEMPVTLSNTARREVRVYLSCTSSDERWSFTPRQLQPLELAAGSDHTVAIVASYAPDRIPESAPVCHARVPLQTAAGQWLDLHLSVEGER